MKILDLDLDLAFEITRDFRLNNFDQCSVIPKIDPGLEIEGVTLGGGGGGVKIQAFYKHIEADPGEGHAPCPC